METNNYQNEYNLLRRKAKSLDIDYSRYTQAQLRHAIKSNNGIIDGSLRARLLSMPPINAYYAAIGSDKVEMHESSESADAQKANPLQHPQALFSSPVKASSMSKSVTSLFTTPLAFPRNSVPL